VRPAGGFNDRSRLVVRLIEAIEARIGIRLHQPCKGDQMLLGVLAATIARIEEHRPPAAVGRKRPVVVNIWAAAICAAIWACAASDSKSELQFKLIEQRPALGGLTKPIVLQLRIVNLSFSINSARCCASLAAAAARNSAALSAAR
jgi:hypothetical protein